MMLKIEGVIAVDVDADQFTDDFIRWIESKGWYFGGAIGKDEEDEDV